MENFDNPVSAGDLEIELAKMINAGQHFVSSTYYLQLKEMVVCSCYERVSALAHAVAVESYPNTKAKARMHSGGNVPLCSQ